MFDLKVSNRDEIVLVKEMRIFSYVNAKNLLLGLSQLFSCHVTSPCACEESNEPPAKANCIGTWKELNKHDTEVIGSDYFVEKILMAKYRMCLPKLYHLGEEPELAFPLLLQLSQREENGTEILYGNVIDCENSCGYTKDRQRDRGRKPRIKHTCFHWKLLMAVSCP